MTTAIPPGKLDIIAELEISLTSGHVHRLVRHETLQETYHIPLLYTDTTLDGGLSIVGILETC